jgi:hypothetical protein
MHAYYVTIHLTNMIHAFVNYNIKSIIYRLFVMQLTFK